MYLQTLAPSWREFHRRLLAHARILVVDDDPGIVDLLARIVRREGFTVDVASSVSEAMQCIGDQPFDLLLVDDHLTDESGLELIAKIEAAQLGIPAILVTAYATPEAIDKAMSVGASDYITKPIDSIGHLVSRIRSVLDRRITTLLFDVMVNDLTKAVHSGGMESRVFAQLSQTLLQKKVSLGQRTNCVLIDPDDERATARFESLRARQPSSIRVASVKEAIAELGTTKAPLVALVSLEAPGSLDSIAEVHAFDPKLEIICCAESTDLETSLAAIDAGAADFALLGAEGDRPLGQRVERLVRRARRHRLFLHLIRTLHEAARAVNPGLADDLFFATPKTDRDYLAAAVPADGAARARDDSA